MTKPDHLKNPNEPLTYNIAQAAQVLQISERKVRQMIAAGVLPLVPHTGRRRLISRKRLAEWLDQATTEPNH